MKRENDQYRAEIGTKQEELRIISIERDEVKDQAMNLESTLQQERSFFERCQRTNGMFQSQSSPQNMFSTKTEDFHRHYQSVQSADQQKQRKAKKEVESIIAHVTLSLQAMLQGYLHSPEERYEGLLQKYQARDGSKLGSMLEQMD